MKFVVDCYGGDLSPKANVLGAVQAVNKFSDLNLILCGRESEIKDNNMRNLYVYRKR